MRTPQRLNLEHDEIIIFRVRKHWFTIAVTLGFIVLAGLAPAVIYNVGIDILFKQGLVTVSYLEYFIAIYTVWLLIVWMSLFTTWTNYYLDVWTLTNKRVIAVEQHGFFSRTTASFRLERLQDVIISIHGIIPTMLNFGTLEIQTAGEERNFMIQGIGHPEALKALILQSAGTLRSSENTDSL